MPKIILTADIHFKEEEPFYSAKKDFFKYVQEMPENNSENYFFVLGDFADSSKHTGKINRNTLEFFQSLKFKKCFVLVGNHDNTRQFGNFLEVLDGLSNVQLLNEPGDLDIEGLHCLALPHYFRKAYSEELMKEKYENMVGTYDFVFGHFPDETEKMFGKFIDTSKINGKKVYGDIHKQTDHYVGPPMPTRSSEAGIVGRFAIIDVNTKELKYQYLPKFLDYYKIEYKDLDSFSADAKYPIVTVDNIPNKHYEVDIVKLLQKNNCYIRELIYQVQDTSKKLTTAEFSNKSIAERLTEFLNNSEYKKSVKEKALKVLSTK